MQYLYCNQRSFVDWKFSVTKTDWVSYLLSPFKIENPSCVPKMNFYNTLSGFCITKYFLLVTIVTYQKATQRILWKTHAHDQRSKKSRKLTYKASATLKTSKLSRLQQWSMSIHKVQQKAKEKINVKAQYQYQVMKHQSQRVKDISSVV